MGSDLEGNIKVLDVQGLADTGAYGEHGPTVFTLVGGKTLPLYNKTIACRYSAKAVYTNKMSAGALRGYGATQGTFAVESTVDKLAEKLNMDPTEIRLKNIINQGEYSEILDGSTKGNPVQLKSSTLNECIRRGKENIEWDKKFPRVKISDNKIRGIGMAVTMQGSGIAGVDVASAILKLNNEGFFTLFLGSTDMGTGSDTTMLQIAAEILDLPTEKFTVHSADTDISPYDTGSYASSTAYVTGNAVAKAAEKMRDEILKHGKKILNSNDDEIEFLDGKISSKNKSITIEELAQEMFSGAEREQLLTEGTFSGNVSPPPFLAGFAEVEVDLETGKVDLINYVAEVDCGTPLNTNIAKIQTEGGIVQGIGMAMYEDVRYTENGKMITDSFMQYKIPSRKDIRNIKVEIVPSYEPTGPFGAKSIGEVVINTPLPAIANAVYNAVGVRIYSLPITPEKVFMGMLEK
jgi:CO/xanthine dehydrogenase Mo-binding subunit